eukprot:8986132-Pyramimonas_sp.AAC.1
MDVNGEDEEVDFDPDIPDAQPSAQEPIIPDCSQQGDLPAQDALPTPTREPRQLLLRLCQQHHPMNRPG